MPFTPGQSGNPKGRPRKGESMAELIRQTADLVADADTGVTWRTRLVTKLYEMACGGNVQAIRLLLEYSIGRPVQRIETDVNVQNVAPFTSDEYALATRDCSRLYRGILHTPLQEAQDHETEE